MSTSTLPLEGKVYLVTGAHGGIGRHVAAALSDAGARVAAVDRHGAARAAGVSPALDLAVDLGDPAAAAQMVQETLASLSRLDGIVHTVGGFAMAPVHEAPLEQYATMMDLNVRTLFHVVRAVLPHFIAQGDGFVAGFSASPGLTGTGPGMPLYAAAKAAVAAFLRSVAEDVAASGVRVAIVYPMGAVDTAANRAAMPGVDPSGFIDPALIAREIAAAAARRGGWMRDLAIYPPVPEKRQA